VQAADAAGAADEAAADAAGAAEDAAADAAGAADVLSDELLPLLQADRTKAPIAARPAARAQGLRAISRILPPM
jgi:hypothetical protein